MFGRMYNIKIANLGWLIIFIGFNLLFFPQFVIGLMGMPRRYFDYLPQFTFGHQVSTIGGYILAVGLFIMIFNLFKGRKGPVALANPWGGKTLEWQIPSPPPHENFDEVPVITGEPYNFE
jgi:cytochrome c oxidase subunit 1